MSQHNSRRPEQLAHYQDPYEDAENARLSKQIEMAITEAMASVGKGQAIIIKSMQININIANGGGATIHAR
jgi:hypothetical protein